MASILSRSSAPAAVVSSRRSQQQQQAKRSVSAAAWQKAITEAELEKADVSFSFSFFCCFLYAREIKAAFLLAGDLNCGLALLRLLSSRNWIECSTRKRKTRAMISSTDDREYLSPFLLSSSFSLFLNPDLLRPPPTPSPPIPYCQPTFPHRASAPSARSPETRSSSPRPAGRSSPSPTSARTWACRWWARPRCCKGKSASSTASSALPARRTARRSRSRTGRSR